MRALSPASEVGSNSREQGRCRGVPQSSYRRRTKRRRRGHNSLRPLGARGWGGRATASLDAAHQSPQEHLKGVQEFLKDFSNSPFSYT
jgi:hypothetical protein